MPVKEHYYIVDYTENYDFILYFYCGGGFGGEYQGALVYSRLPGQKIPEQVNQRFQLAMERLGVSKYVPKWDDWCVPDYKNCHNLE